jgi:Ca-activated chloride channel family protein
VAQSSSIKPWNLVFLVDVSGSMNEPNKLPLVQRSLELLVNQMRPGDRVSLVTYAGSSGVVLPPTEISERSKILSAISNLASGGGTHGAAGIQEAYRLAQESFIKDGVNRVILATDGDFNVGVTSTQELIRLIEEKRKSGVTLTTLGFGTGNYHEALIEQLANKGDGNYFYIDSFGEARKVFETNLWGTVQVVAKDVKLQVEFNPAHVLEHRLIGYENRALQHHEFSDDRVDAGEIGSGHRVTALYEVVLAGTAAAARIVHEFRYEQNLPAAGPTGVSQLAGEVAFLKIRYKEPSGGESRLLTFPVLRGEVKDRIESASMNFRFAAAVAAFAQKLRQSPLAPELSYAEIADLAAGALGPDVNGLRREFVEFVRSQAALEASKK